VRQRGWAEADCPTRIIVAENCSTDGAWEKLKAEIESSVFQRAGMLGCQLLFVALPTADTFRGR